MVVQELFISLLLAVLLTGFYVFLNRGAGRRRGVLWLFLAIFLATWAGGAWLKPFGPTVWGIHWLTFLLAGLVIVLFLVIVMPQTPPRGREETLDMLEDVEQEKEIEEVTYITLGVFFWILLFVLVAAIIFRYIIGMDFM